MKKEEMEKQLLNIAMANSTAMEYRKSFEKKNNDGDDFVEVGIWGLKKMLEEAYLLGQESR